MVGEPVPPDAEMDTPNHAYSLSFGRGYPWSRYFALRDEIQDYLEQCTDDFCCTAEYSLSYDNDRCDLGRTAHSLASRTTNTHRHPNRFHTFSP
ncbi:MAG: hypothetical protein Ct9H300mP16_18260 [Pseudomonadota bacterium]|nr:MAG: hypothetical protein Ct9H300mP16_18260 [Pseudomonadota bacterium]